MEIQRLLKPKEVAKLLGVEPATLTIWRCTGRVHLPFCKVGRLVAYREKDVVAFIESRMHGQAEKKAA